MCRFWFTPVRSELIRRALVDSVGVKCNELKEAKQNLEHAIAQDLPFSELNARLEAANKAVKEEIKHAAMHLPKPKGKAKAKAKAAA